ncbi:MAG: hypothetical protein AAF721_04305 [Myxococcota bacterium]
MRIVHGSLLALSLAGCTAPAPADSGKPAVADGPQTATPANNESPAKEAAPPTKEAEPVADAAQWRCASDKDCVQTCALGAVNGAWIAKNPNADDCDDGCGWKSGMTACRDSECVTLDNDGNIDASCTKRPPRKRD